MGRRLPEQERKSRKSTTKQKKTHNHQENQANTLSHATDKRTPKQHTPPDAGTPFTGTPCLHHHLTPRNCLSAAALSAAC
mmetsp:Transcript_35505/g.83139  ORF Transcript_35505/g.83139 Transcript_35505/m.83139 type:complete len:80 (+) Transcript_35505:348-587(+)